MDAIYRSGTVNMGDYTPSADVSAGDVVVLEDIPAIAHSDIAAAELGALGISGGVYDLVADGEHVGGKKVYWNATAKKITTSAGSHKHFGYVTPDGGSTADDDPIEVEHRPDGSATSV